MWRNKKFIISAVVIAMLLVGVIGSIAIAADDGDDSGIETKFEALWNRVGEIYQEKTGVALDQEALKESIAQAQKEMREEALDTYLQNLVDEGKITQEQAEQYKTWWQARPDMPFPNSFPRFGGRCYQGGGMMWNRALAPISDNTI